MNNTPQNNDEQPQPEPKVKPLQKIEGETPESFEAFMCYFDLGHKRSLRKLEAMLDTNISTLKHWSTQHHWRDRISEHHHQMWSTRLESEQAAAIEASLASLQQEKASHDHDQELGSFLQGIGTDL